MPQVYLLTEVYLFLCSGVMLSNRLGPRFLFLLNLRSFYTSNSIVRRVWFLIGFVLAVCNLFFPIAPGPVVIGDLLPAVTIMFVILRLVLVRGREENGGSVIELKDSFFDWIVLGVSSLHFLFPGIVII